MPGRADDKHFGNKRGGSRKAWQAMVAHYGLSRGTRVYHAVRNRNRRKNQARAR